MLKQGIRGILVLTSMMAVSAQAVPLASQTITGSLDVEKYAEINGLADISLSKDDPSATLNAVWSGGDEFELRANCPVLVSVSGGDMTHGDGITSIPSNYYLDGVVDSSFETSDVHSGNHNLNAKATVADLAAQKSGAYSASITLTVSPL